jgi:hypothetical protein
MSKSLLPLLASVALAATFTAAPALAQGQSEAQIVQHLKDRADIQDLISGYLSSLDTGDYERNTAMITEDGVLTFGGHTYTGRDEIRAILKQALRAPGAKATDANGKPLPVLRHMAAGFDIQIDGDTAKSRGTWATISMGRESYPTIGGLGYYDDHYVRQNGKWYFSSRELVVELAAQPASGRK